MAKTSPRASTLKAKSIPGKRLNPVNEMGPFFSTQEVMDKAIKQSAILPASVTLSRKFGLLSVKRMNKATSMGTITAHTGRKLMVNNSVINVVICIIKIP